MTIKKWMGLLVLMLSLGLPAFAQARLVGILPKTAGGTDYQAYYDTGMNLSWLANADMNGLMHWSTANRWAEDLTVTGYVGGTQTVSSGWRLPAIDTLSNLYYNVLGGQSFSYDGYNLPFTNIQDSFYWSATKYGGGGVVVSNYDAWAYWFGFGKEAMYIGSDGSEGTPYYAWAVHSGDPAAVPAPGSLLLMVAGLAFLGLLLRRRPVGTLTL